MSDHLTDLIDQLPGRDPSATPEQIRAAETALGRTLPPDYVSFLLRANGAEGSVTESTYLVLDSVDTLASTNADLHADEFRHGVLAFGSDGGGEGFFFDFHTPGPTVLMIAWISNWKEEARWAGDSFTDFLERTLRGESPSDHERHV